MIRAVLVSIVSILLALGASEGLHRAFAFRQWLGKVTRRGELLLLVRQNGIYDRDLERAWENELYLRGSNPGEVDPMAASGEKRALLERLAVRTQLEATAAAAPLDRTEVDQEMEWIRWEYAGAKNHAESLGKAGWTSGSLERELVCQARVRSWLEAQIAAQLSPNESETRKYFDAHQARWEQPARWRAAHLFLAAPDGSPAEVIEDKRALIDLLATRLSNGESFPALVAEFSEDEATKKQGGDLGYFAERRMLPEIIAAVRQLQPGQISPPIQSHLGFHLLRLTESLPARSLTYEEARPEIIAELENRRRTQAVGLRLVDLP